MALTLTLQRNLRYIFAEIYRHDTSVSSSTPSNNGDAFSRWLEADLSNNDIEIPIFIRSRVENLIKSAFNGKVYVPIQYGHSAIVRTGDAIINNFFKTSSKLLIKINTTKGIYYGNSGIILDSNFNVIFLATLNCHKEESNILYTGVNIYIHPKVFLEEKKVLYSCIFKKLIPFYLSLTVNKVLLGFSREHPQYDLTPQIIIKDVTSNFINIASVPNPQSTSNESINQFLIDHQEDIIDQL